MLWNVVSIQAAIVNVVEVAVVGKNPAGPIVAVAARVEIFLVLLVKKMLARVKVVVAVVMMKDEVFKVEVWVVVKAVVFKVIFVVGVIAVLY
jgi:hypothetical protein